MARIAGVDLPREKKVEIGLTYIYGIGRKLNPLLTREVNTGNTSHLSLHLQIITTYLSPASACAWGFRR